MACEDGVNQNVRVGRRTGQNLRESREVGQVLGYRGERFVLGWRIDLDAVDGRPPFWGYPWVTLRGVPAMRYQNERTGVAEVELRWNIFDRWAVLGFVGSGDTDGDIPAFDTEDDIVAGGVGGRWLFKPEMGLWVGVDIAQGPERTAYYIQIGHAW